MAVQNIPRPDWEDFCHGFSRRHQGWLVSIEWQADDDYRLIRQEKRLNELSLQPNKTAVTLDIGSGARDRELLGIPDPKYIGLHFDRNGADSALEVRLTDESIVTVRFRAAARPDTVDGYEYERR